MKRRIRGLIAVIISFSIFVSTLVTGTYAMEDANVPLISIVLGTGEVQINGELVEFEAPYSVDGVLLVPVELIAEAFGVFSQISEDGNSLILEHPEVCVAFEIDSTLADVNDIPISLPIAPQIKNTSFMVPLRFISETFGGTVNYNGENKTVTVITSSDEEVGSIIKGGIESPKIGDSKFSWSMENASDLNVEDYESDGSYTRLMSEDYDKNITIRVEEIEDNYDFERDYYTKRYSVSDNTLLYASKDDSDPNKRTIRIKEKYYGYYDTYIIVTDKYYYEVCGGCESESKEDRETISRIVSSFDTVFNKEDTHDLHKGKSGNDYQLFESEELNLSLELPSYFETENINNYDNGVAFESLEEDNYTSSVSIDIYSKEDELGAADIAEMSHKFSSMYYNEKISKVSENVTEAQYANIKGYEYEVLCEGKFLKSYIRKVFFEVGDCVYFLVITLDLPNDNAKKQADYICNSLKAEPIEDEDFEKILYNVPEITGNTYVYDGDGWEVTLPEGYVCDEGSYYVCFMLASGLMEISCDFEKDSRIKNLAGIKAELDEYKTIGDYFEKFEVIQPLRKVMIGKDQYFEMAFYVGDGDTFIDIMYCHLLATYRNGRPVVFNMEVPEHLYSEKAVNDMYEMAKTLKFTKE